MEASSKVLRKGAWSAEEDSLLKQCVDKYGEGKWHQVPLRAGLNRCRKSCRLRWLNYLKPSIKKGKLCSDEVDLLIRLHKLLGNRWSLIAGRLPGRTANDVKNYWNTHLSKKHESCGKTKMKKRNIVSPSTTPTQKVYVFKPRPRSFSVNNSSSYFSGLQEAGGIPSSLGLNNNNVCENSNNDEFVNNLTNEDNMWLESILEESQGADALEESQGADALGPEATATNKEATLAFDVEHLWSLIDGETMNFD